MSYFTWPYLTSSSAWKSVTSLSLFHVTPPLSSPPSWENSVWLLYMWRHDHAVELLSVTIRWEYVLQYVSKFNFTTHQTSWLIDEKIQAKNIFYQPKRLHIGWDLSIWKSCSKTTWKWSEVHGGLLENYILKCADLIVINCLKSLILASNS